MTLGVFGMAKLSYTVGDIEGVFKEMLNRENKTTYNFPNYLIAMQYVLLKMLCERKSLSDVKDDDEDDDDD